MANSLSPTAANIISSLGVKGAVTDVPYGQGASFAGFVPMLDGNGKISLSVIPPGAAEMSVPPLSGVAFVDPGTTAETRNGSIAAPFSSIAEAAAAGAATMALTPGSYEEGVVQFSGSPSVVCLISLGVCRLSSATRLAGMAPGCTIYLQGVRTQTTDVINVDSASPTVVCVGCTRINGTLNSAESSPMTLKLSSDSYVASTNAVDVEYLSEDVRIKNTSSVRGANVGVALGRLGSRRIRVLSVSTGESGLVIDGYDDVTAADAGGYDVFDLREHDRRIVDGINDLVKTGRDIDTDTITAKTVNAETINTGDMHVDSLKIGGYRLYVDLYGYLVVDDGANPPEPSPSGVVMIKDSVTGTIYILGMSNGRAYVANAEDEEIPPTPVPRILYVEDDVTGEQFCLSIEDGRLTLRKMEGSSSSGGGEPPREVYIINDSTGKYHRLTAVYDSGTGEITAGVDQRGVEW